MAKVMISLPDDLLDRIDDAATRASTSRSAWLRSAVEARLGIAEADDVERLMAETRARISRLQGPSAVDLIRAQRDGRHAGTRSP